MNRSRDSLHPFFRDRKVWMHPTPGGPPCGRRVNDLRLNDRSSHWNERRLRSNDRPRTGTPRHALGTPNSKSSDLGTKRASRKWLACKDLATSGGRTRSMSCGLEPAHDQGRQILEVATTVDGRGQDDQKSDAFTNRPRVGPARRHDANWSSLSSFGLPTGTPGDDQRNRPFCFGW